MYKKLLLCVVYGSCVMAMESKTKETEKSSLVKPGDPKMKTKDKDETPLFKPSGRTNYLKSLLGWWRGEGK